MNIRVAIAHVLDKVTERQLLRILSLVVGFIFALIGWITVNYPPDFLFMADLWSAMFIGAGLLSMAFCFCKNVTVGIVSGGLSATAAFLRGFCLVAEAGLSGLRSAFLLSDDIPQPAAYIVGGLQWTLIGILILVLWPILVVAVGKSK